MQKLDRDPRGYPIPVQVLRDKTGRPHFTINDSGVRLRLLIDGQCPICGEALLSRKWFAGGPRSAFDENGWYIDLPMHHECMRYAMQVCPYLAAPNYSGRIDGATLRDKAVMLIDNTMIPDRPKLFVAVMSKKMEVGRGGEYVRPVRPFLGVEYWREGKRLSESEGRAIVQEVMSVPVEPIQQPRTIFVR